MAVTESWVLDGLDISSGNFQILELEASPPKAKPEFITAADSEWGALARQPLHENRTITFRLRVTPQASMNAALDQVGLVVDKLRKASSADAGIPLVWTPANSTRTRTFDVLMGEITDLPISVNDQGRSWFLQRPIFTVEMTCKPYGYGTETLTSTASSSTPITTLEVAGVTGDIPALGRLIVTDSATQNRRHVEWGNESQYYNSSSPSSLLIDSDSLTVSGFAGAQTTQAGAYDPNATGNNAISVTPTFFPVAMAGTGDQTHIGTFKVKARMWCPVILGANNAQLGGQVRLSWAVGAQPTMPNPWVSPTLGGRWEELDLGYITIPPASVGGQRWTGQIEIQGFVDLSTGVAGTAYLDYLLLIPAAEGYGRARASYAYTPGVLVARDEFTSTSSGGALSGRVAPLGGTWATAGDATDLAFVDFLGGEGVQRSTTSDATVGRFAVIGSTNYTDVEVSAAVLQNVTANPISSGVLARYTDTSNHLRFFVSINTVAIEQTIAGVSTRLAGTNAWRMTPGVVYFLRLVVYASGRAVGTITDVTGSRVLFTLDAQSSTLATGGTLATGKAGIWDRNPIATASLRYYDAVGIATPAPEPPVIYSTRTIEFRHDDTIRTDSTGTYYGRPPSYRGSRFLLQPGTNRVVAKARRNDIESQADDTVTDATQIRVGWTPRFLVVTR